VCTPVHVKRHSRLPAWPSHCTLHTAVVSCCGMPCGSGSTCKWCVRSCPRAFVCTARCGMPTRGPTCTPAANSSGAHLQHPWFQPCTVSRDWQCHVCPIPGPYCLGAHSSADHLCAAFNTACIPALGPQASCTVPPAAAGAASPSRFARGREYEHPTGKQLRV
jgi:hypothetical protein